ncbi:hypothetical protein KP509_11G015500 [Ceratopteris richardii]|nr:hypothetical protein KP509_11G015500 [Ceratopteris richardii]
MKVKNEKDLAKCLHLHSVMCQSGLDVHQKLGNKLVTMFVEAGGMVYAKNIYNKLPNRREPSWNSLVAGYIKHGQPKQAIQLYKTTTEDNNLAGNDTVLALLKASAMLKDSETGMQIHAEVSRRDLLEKSVYVCNTLIHMYAQCGLFTRAEEVLMRHPFQRVCYWNSLMGGYMEHGHFDKALCVLEQMQHEGISPNAVTHVYSLKACGSIGAILKGHEIHSELVMKEHLRSNVFISSSLVDMYVKCGSLQHAEETFDKLEVRNVVSWNSIMTAYLNKNQGHKAIQAFKQMKNEGVPPDSGVFICALKACISTGLVDEGRELHFEILLKGFENNSLTTISLIDLYGKFGLLHEAQNVFDRLPNHSVVSSTALMAAYMNCGHDEMALHCYENACRKGLSPDCLMFVSSIKACVNMELTSKGEQLHAEVVKQGLLESDLFVASAVVDMYMKGGLLKEGHWVFKSLAVKDVALWNAFIAGYAEQGFALEAFEYIQSMWHEGICPNPTTYISCLKVCVWTGEISRGRQIHSEIVKLGWLESELYNMLIDFYSKSGLIQEAKRLLDDPSSCDAVPWNALSAGYIEEGCYEQSLQCFCEMQNRGIVLNPVALTLRLKASGMVGAIKDGQDLHAYIILVGKDSEVIVNNALVDAYSKFGLFMEAYYVFSNLQICSIISWNSLIAGYTHHGHFELTLDCFEQFSDRLSPDAITLVSCMRACCSIRAIEKGQELHLLIVKKGLEGELSVGNSLVDFYATYNLLFEAENVLKMLPVQNVPSWTALILGNIQNGHLEEAFYCFHQMQEIFLSPDAVTLFCISTVCGLMRATAKGREIHSEIVKRGYLESCSFSGSNLVDMYVKWGLLSEAHQVFEMLPRPDTISFNILMTGYANHGNSKLALICFEQMQRDCISQDFVSFVCGLMACSNLGAFIKAQVIHIEAVKRGLELGLTIGNTLVDLYAKCGSILDACGVFAKLSTQELIAWNALIVGYGQLGESIHVFSLLDKMVRQGMGPDVITFVNILNACSHCGLVEQAQECLKAIELDYDLIQTKEHFHCAVDLFGRAGQIEKAFVLAEWMPYHPDILVWHTILGACRKWSNVGLGRHVFEHAVRLDQMDVSTYTYMCNIFMDSIIQGKYTCSD